MFKIDTTIVLADYCVFIDSMFDLKGCLFLWDVNDSENHVPLDVSFFRCLYSCSSLKAFKFFHKITPASFFHVPFKKKKDSIFLLDKYTK